MDAIKSEFLMELRLDVAPMVNTGATERGERRFAHVTGGRFDGPRLKGEVLDGGSDAIFAQPGGRLLLDVLLPAD
jgi:uncharacterized protein DUF3237